MAQETKHVIQHELGSPRSAAIAGIVYSVLMFTIMVLTTGIVGAKPEKITGD